MTTGASTDPDPTTDERLAIEYLDLESIRFATRNPKAHDLPTIQASLQRHGWGDGAAIRDEGTGQIVAGHGRVEAARDLKATGQEPPRRTVVDEEGRWLVPVVVGASWPDPAEAEAFLVGHNQTTILGGWLTDELAPVLQDIAATPLGLEGTGYTLEDLAPQQAPDQPADPDTPELDLVPAICEPGDLWQIGPHRLIVGDCRDPEVWARLLDGLGQAALAVTSPPYADRRPYDPDSGFRPIHPDHYVEWFAPIPELVAAHLTPDGSWVLNIRAGAEGLDRDLYVYDLVIAHVRQWGWHLGDDFCWERPGLPGNRGRRLKNQWEPVFHFARADWKWRPKAVRRPSDHVPAYVVGDNYVGEHRQGDGTSTLAGRPQDPEGLAYPGNRLPTFTGSHEAVGHSAAYPVGLPAFFALLLTDEGDLLLDPFLGSGSTILAAHQTKRVGAGIELSPRYADQALARLQRHLDLQPTRDGQPHDFTPLET